MTISMNKPPIWFWIVSVLALIWNLMGVNQYLQQAYNTDSFKAMYTPDQLDQAAQQPAWYAASFAIAVFCGALGCIFLLLRKKWANIMFILSLIGIIGQMVYNLVLNDYIKDAGAFAISMQIVIPIVAVLLILLSKKAIAKTWIS
ncbi:DUF4293 family protein [uncultured Winogradskyella sp.]|uniref:DUF4293 family protein n=1 Tax=uncultured Winogradskyella sp. TaxID=395353 RepID=UPI0030D868D9|tara:strand:+ start:26 stop:460 length:435 start_codon:yes stop_codon:yes gene_type:complete